jgi:hypothetical protein
MNLDHIVVAARTRRIPVGDAADATLDDRIIRREAMRKRIISVGSRTEQRAGLVTFFEQVAEQEG